MFRKFSIWFTLFWIIEQQCGSDITPMLAFRIMQPLIWLIYAPKMMCPDYMEKYLPILSFLKILAGTVKQLGEIFLKKQCISQHEILKCRAIVFFSLSLYYILSCSCWICSQKKQRNQIMWLLVITEKFQANNSLPLRLSLITKIINRNFYKLLGNRLNFTRPRTFHFYEAKIASQFY